MNFNSIYNNLTKRCKRKGYAHLISYPLSLILATWLLSCSMIDEDLDECATNKVKPDLYVTLSITIPDEAVTRTFTTTGGNASETDDYGNERLPGTTKENELRSAVIYLVDENYKVKLPLATTDISINGNEKTLIAKIDDINDLTELAGQTLKVIVVVNGTQTGLNVNLRKDDDITKSKFFVSSLTDNKPIGPFGITGQTMPFVNAEDEVTIKIPTNASGKPVDILNAIQDQFTSNGQGEAFWTINDSKKPINLERAVARLEYKDASSGDNIYKISNTDNLNIQLYSIQPFNVNTGSYLFRHTAAGNNTEATDEDNIFGIENGDGDGYNWVAGSDWSLNGTTYSVNKSFLNNITVNEEGYSIEQDGDPVSIEDIMAATNEQDGDDYHPFYYVTENTIHTTDLMSDDLLPSYATGVAFKFVVLGSDKQPLQYENSSNYPSSITKAEDTEQRVIRITNKNNQWIELQPTKVKVKKVTASIDEGDENIEDEYEDVEYYFLTYIGFIYHNNPETKPEGATIAPMQYGVVRNNTYQLSINSIEEIPFPKEPESYYLSLSIKVLAWAKRDISVSW